MRDALLALELSADPSWLAVERGGHVVERSFSGERGRALLVEVEALLADAGVAREELEAVIAGTGPGSYTGLRIACAAARTLAFALGIPAGGVGSFAAAALAAPPGREVHLLTDAYRNEAYHAAYLRTESGVEERVAPRVLSREAALTAVPEGAVFIGDPALCAGKPEVLLDRVGPRASALIEIQRTGAPPFQAPIPLYLRAAARRRSRRAGGAAGK